MSAIALTGQQREQLREDWAEVVAWQRASGNWDDADVAEVRAHLVAEMDRGTPTTQLAWLEHLAVSAEAIRCDRAALRERLRVAEASIRALIADRRGRA